MTPALVAAPARPLDPVRAALEHLRAGSPQFGVAANLVTGADTAAGWLPATSLVDGSRVPDLLELPRRLWRAPAHAAAALAFKQYTYWLAMPAVLGWALARRVPLLDAGNVLVHLGDPGAGSTVTIGMRGPYVAVLPDDPAAGLPGTRVVGTGADLLATLRATLLDQHVTPLVTATRSRVRIGAHTLYGQFAASVGYVLAAAASLLPGTAVEDADTLLGALGMADLAELRDDGDGPAVRRSTCCLAFVAPGLRGRACPDCCVRRATAG